MMENEEKKTCDDTDTVSSDEFENIDTSEADVPEPNMKKDISNEHLANEIEELKETVQKLQEKVGALDTCECDDASKTHSPAKEKKKFAWVKEVIFYLVIIALLVGVFFVRSNADGQPVMIAGYSAFMVKTSSMQSEIPKGSLVVTKSVDADTLNIGDDITYMVSPTTSITHRIIGITENYNNTGERAFETQGIMNSKPDENLVPAGNIVGKVVFHSEAVGMAAAFISINWPIIIFVMVVIFALFFVLNKVLKDDTPKTKKTKA